MRIPMISEAQSLLNNQFNINERGRDGHTLTCDGCLYCEGGLFERERTAEDSIHGAAVVMFILLIESRGAQRALELIKESGMTPEQVWILCYAAEELINDYTLTDWYGEF